MLFRAGYCVALMSFAFARPTRGQGDVSGQVSILERPGEQTSDLGNTVVFLEGGVAPRPTKIRKSDAHAQMSMQSRQFSPRVVAVTTGSTVAFPNQDPFNHNIFSNAPGASFDLGLYARGGSKDAQFKKPGAFPVFCNIHSRMTGYVVVVPGPLFTQPGLDGRFLIHDVPAGRYVVHFWHERAPEQTREIVVPDAGVGAINAQLDARGYTFVAHKNKFGQEYKSAGGDRY